MPRPTAVPPDSWAALGDPTRRRVLAAIAPGPRSVTAISAGLPVSRPAVSQHLKVLLDVGLVEAHRHGRHHLYQVRTAALEELRRELESFWGTGLSNLKRVSEETYRGRSSDTSRSTE